MTKAEIAAVLRSISENVAVIADGIADESIESYKKEAAPAKEAVNSDKEDKAIRLEDVRAVLSEISRSGHTAEMKALLAKHGAKKLSDVPAEEYEQLLAEAEEVKNA